MIGRRKEERRAQTMSERFWVAMFKKGRQKSDPPAAWARLFEPSAVGVALLLFVLVAVVMFLGGCKGKPFDPRNELSVIEGAKCSHMAVHLVCTHGGKCKDHRMTVKALGGGRNEP